MLFAGAEEGIGYLERVREVDVVVGRAVDDHERTLEVLAVGQDR